MDRACSQCGCQVGVELRCVGFRQEPLCGECWDLIVEDLLEDDDVNDALDLGDDE